GEERLLRVPRRDDLDREPEASRQFVAVAEGLGEEKPGVDEDHRHVPGNVTPHVKEHAAPRSERRGQEHAVAPVRDRPFQAFLGRAALQPFRMCARLLFVHAAYSPAFVSTRKPSDCPMSCRSVFSGGGFKSGARSSVTFLASTRRKYAVGDSPSA